MVWHYPPTPRQLAATGGFFFFGLALIAVGVHLSYVNVAPQRARAQARRKFVLDYIGKKLDQTPPPPPPPPPPPL